MLNNNLYKRSSSTLMASSILASDGQILDNTATEAYTEYKAYAVPGSNLPFPRSCMKRLQEYIATTSFGEFLEPDKVKAGHFPFETSLEGLISSAKTMSHDAFYSTFKPAILAPANRKMLDLFLDQLRYDALYETYLALEEEGVEQALIPEYLHTLKEDIDAQKHNLPYREALLYNTLSRIKNNFDLLDSRIHRARRRYADLVSAHNDVVAQEAQVTFKSHLTTFEQIRDEMTSKYVAMHDELNTKAKEQKEALSRQAKRLQEDRGTLFQEKVDLITRKRALVTRIQEANAIFNDIQDHVEIAKKSAVEANAQMGSRKGRGHFAAGNKWQQQVNQEMPFLVNQPFRLLGNAVKSGSARLSDADIEQLCNDIDAYNADSQTYLKKEESFNRRLQKAKEDYLRLQDFIESAQQKCRAHYYLTKSIIMFESSQLEAEHKRAVELHAASVMTDLAAHDVKRDLDRYAIEEAELRAEYAKFQEQWTSLESDLIRHRLDVEEFYTRKENYAVHLGERDAFNQNCTAFAAHCEIVAKRETVAFKKVSNSRDVDGPLNCTSISGPALHSLDALPLPDDVLPSLDPEDELDMTLDTFEDLPARERLEDPVLVPEDFHDAFKLPNVELEKRTVRSKKITFPSELPSARNILPLKETVDVPEVLPKSIDVKRPKSPGTSSTKKVSSRKPQGRAGASAGSSAGSKTVKLPPIDGQTRKSRDDKAAVVETMSFETPHEYVNQYPVLGRMHEMATRLQAAVA